MGVVLATISLFNLIVDSIFLLFYNQYSILVYLSVIGLSIAISVIYTSLLIPAVYLAGINGSSIVFSDTDCYIHVSSKLIENFYDK